MLLVIVIQLDWSHSNESLHGFYLLGNLSRLEEEVGLSRGILEILVSNVYDLR